MLVHVLDNPVDQHGVLLVHVLFNLADRKVCKLADILLNLLCPGETEYLLIGQMVRAVYHYVRNSIVAQGGQGHIDNGIGYDKIIRKAALRQALKCPVGRAHQLPHLVPGRYPQVQGQLLCQGLDQLLEASHIGFPAR